MKKFTENLTETQWGIIALLVAPIPLSIYFAVVCGLGGVAAKAFHFMVRSMAG